MSSSVSWKLRISMVSIGIVRKIGPNFGTDIWMQIEICPIMASLKNLVVFNPLQSSIVRSDLRPIHKDGVGHQTTNAGELNDVVCAWKKNVQTLGAFLTACVWSPSCIPSCSTCIWSHLIRKVPNQTFSPVRSGMVKCYQVIRYRTIIKHTSYTVSILSNQIIIQYTVLFYFTKKLQESVKHMKTYENILRLYQIITCWSKPKGFRISAASLRPSAMLGAMTTSAKPSMPWQLKWSEIVFVITYGQINWK